MTRPASKAGCLGKCMNWHVSLTRSGAATLWWLSLALLVGVACYASGYETRRAMERAAVESPGDAARRLAFDLLEELGDGDG